MKLFQNTVIACLLMMGSILTSLSAESEKSILLILTNHSQFADTEKLTGLFLSEAAHPYYLFTKAGYNVT